MMITLYYMYVPCHMTMAKHLAKILEKHVKNGGVSRTKYGRTVEVLEVHTHQLESSDS